LVSHIGHAVSCFRASCTRKRPIIPPGLAHKAGRPLNSNIGPLLDNDSCAKNMKSSDKIPHLRLVVGNKLDAKKDRKVMTEIGLLDESDLHVWNLVKQVPRPSMDALLEEMRKEDNRIQGLLSERLGKLPDLFPDAIIDLEYHERMDPLVLEFLFSYPLVLGRAGNVFIVD